MREKSKFITFLLSFVPGMSHFYIGYADRGIIYLSVLGLVLLGSVGICFLVGDDSPMLIFLFAAPIIWLIALIDAFSLMGGSRYIIENQENQPDLENGEVRKVNKNIITLALSIIPGAGHMYLGYQEKGLIYMGMFFFSIFLMGWLNLGFILFLVPLIWFYSFFDAFHLVNENKIEDIEDDMLNLLPRVNHEYIGKGLIILGLIILLQKIFLPVISIYLDYQIRNFIQASIVSLVFIFLGIKMLGKKKEVNLEGEEDED